MKFFRNLVIALVLCFGFYSVSVSDLAEDVYNDVSANLFKADVASKKGKQRIEQVSEKLIVQPENVIYASFVPESFDIDDFADLLKTLKRQKVDNFVFLFDDAKYFKFAILADKEFSDKNIMRVNVSDKSIEDLDKLAYEFANMQGNTVLFAFPMFSEGLSDGSVNDSNLNAEDRNLSDKDSNLNYENLDIDLADFGNDLLEKNMKSFHDSMIKNVFDSFDKGSVWRTDASELEAVYTVMSYLDLKNARHYEIFENNFDASGSFDGSFEIDDFISADEILNFYLGEAESDDRSVSIMAFGDMMLSRDVRTKMNVSGKDYIFEALTGSYANFFKGSDFLFANLEGPIHGAGTSGGTAMSFSFNEDVAPFLKDYDFNILSITNNHAVDQGWDGRDTTIVALDASDIGWCGHPMDADADSVFYDEIGDKKIAFVCFQDVSFQLNDEAALELIKEIRANVDFLIVSIHWGQEYKHVPNNYLQIQVGHDFVDAGADFIIGHHPHVVQSFEVYNDKFIFYSLGNFVFDQYWSTMTQEELAIGIELGEDKTRVNLFPMKSSKAQSRLMTEAEYNVWIEEFIGYGEYSEKMMEMIRAGVLEG